MSQKQRDDQEMWSDTHLLVGICFSYKLLNFTLEKHRLRRIAITIERMFFFIVEAVAD